MSREIRKAYNENDLEIGVQFIVWRGGASSPNVFPYEGKVNEHHAFMNTEDTLYPSSPIESFRGSVQFREDGLIVLNQKDYDCYMPEDEIYKTKWDLVKRE